MDDIDPPFSPFLPVDPQPQAEPQPEDLLGYIPPQLKDTTTYHVPSITPPKKFTGRLIAEHVWSAHEVIGGAPALAQWAARNRTRFYTTTLAKMLPQGASPLLQSNEPQTFEFNVPIKSIDIVAEQESASGSEERPIGDS